MQPILSFQILVSYYHQVLLVLTSLNSFWSVVKFYMFLLFDYNLKGTIMNTETEQKKSIYSAYRSGMISKEVYQKYVKDGYNVKTTLINVQ